MIYASLPEAMVLMQPQAKKKRSTVQQRRKPPQRCAQPRKGRILTGLWAETLPLPCHATNPTILLLDAADARLALKPLGTRHPLGTSGHACLDKPPAKLRRPSEGVSAQKSMMVPISPYSPYSFNSTEAHLTWSIWGFAHGLSACASSLLPFTTIFSIYHPGSGSIRYMHLFTALLVLFV